ESLDLLKREQLAALCKDRVFFRHAIEAAYVAAIRDADAQVVVHPAKTVDQGFCGDRLHRIQFLHRVFTMVHNASGSGVAQGRSDGLASTPGCTHSRSPSAQFSRFQMGTISLTRSIMNRQASKAWARCGQLTAIATLTSPNSRCPMRCISTLST